MKPLALILARLQALHPKRIDLSLGRIERLLARIGHPERSLPPVIHVAGTNGKGSTIAFMRAMLEAAGLRAHAYTSPHLVRFNERFRLGRAGGGALVDDDELAGALEECERANGGAPITFFEITTAAGFLLFSRHPADALLLEVGLGGRLDATNVIARPAAAVITPVALDHADYLGDTISEIAAEKAGILKPGAPGVIAIQHHDALRAIERQAARVKATLAIAGEDWHVTEEHGRLLYQDERGLIDLPAPRLFGRHQFTNAGTAIAALRAARLFDLPASVLEAGLLKADWPARMQRLASGRLVELIPQASELWLDGGHNPEGGRAISAALADLEERVPRPLVVVAGMLSSKDHRNFLRNFVGLARHLIAVPISGQEHALPPEAIAEAAEALGIPARPALSLAQALVMIGELGVEPPVRILITGSLYLAGEALSANGTPPE